MHKSNKRIAAAVVALALGFSTAGAGVFAPVAGAQVTINENMVSTVNMDLPVSLTIEKYIGLPVADGNTTGMPTLAGAQFKIQKIEGIDLQTLAGWQSIQGLNPNNITHDLTDIATLTTDENGQDSISTSENSNFTVGVYLVTETAPAGYTGADPFIVTLPFADGGVWNYSQTVKPKNQESEFATKTVVDANKTIGDTIDYTVKSQVPTGTTKLVMKDELPTGCAWIRSRSTASLCPPVRPRWSRTPITPSLTTPTRC